MKKERIDCLLVHVPKNISPEAGYIALLSMGLFALADILDRNGFSSRILHLGVERIKDPHFSIEDYLEGKEILAIGLSLHWHFQSPDTIRIVNRIKAVRPKIKTVLGGFTASFFAREIMDTFRAVDFLIKGDGEIPLLQLIQTLSRGGTDFSGLPNLLWRQGGKVRENDLGYVAGSQDLNALDFTNFNLLENFPLYRKTTAATDIHFYREETLSDYRIFPLFVGRGCSVNCAFCGGSKLSQKLINHRTRVSVRSPEKVLESMTAALRAGFHEVFICFDPWRRREYFRRLFRRVRKSRLDVRLRFGCWSLPSRDFIDDFRKTFMPGSSFEISPETGSDRLRKLIKGYPFTNRQLISTLAYLQKRRIPADIYFGYPLPLSEGEELEQTERLIEFLRSEFGAFHRVTMTRMSFDPGSPMYVYPDQYRIDKHLDHFLAYCRPPDGAGYQLRGSRSRVFRKVFAKYDREQEGLWLYSQARAHFDLGHYEDAVEGAKKAVSLAPEQTDAYLLLASCFEEMKKPREAIGVYHRAIRIFPHRGALYVGLARSYVMLRDFRRAVENALHARDLNFDGGNLPLLLGFCYERMGQAGRAAEALLKAKELNPQSAEIHFALSRCYGRMGEKEKAEKELSEGIVKYRNSDPDSGLRTGASSL